MKTYNYIITFELICATFAAKPLIIDNVGDEFDNMRIQVEPPTKAIPWMFNLLILESRRTASTGSRVPRKRPRQSPPKRARAREYRN